LGIERETVPDFWREWNHKLSTRLKRKHELSTSFTTQRRACAIVRRKHKLSTSFRENCNLSDYLARFRGHMFAQTTAPVPNCDFRPTEP
jgi:hypothetical protein